MGDGDDSVDPIREEHLRQVREAEARKFAQQYLMSKNEPNYSSEPAPREPVNFTRDPNAPPAPPSGQSLGGALKKGMSDQAGLVKKYGPAALEVAGAILAPGGAAVRQGAKRFEPSGKPETYGPPSDLKQTSQDTTGNAPPQGQEDNPLILGGGGVGQMVSPAGMMPTSESTSVHQGRDVPLEAKRAFNAGTDYAVRGAEKEAAAHKEYYDQVRGLAATRMQAQTDAATQHAAVQANRDMIVKSRLAAIEAANAEASAAIDPNKYWTDRGAAAGALGAIMVGLNEWASRKNGVQNSVLPIFERGINREIQSQLSNRQVAGQKVARMQTLLGLHMDALQDKDKAIDATKLALWSNLDTQVDAAAAKKGMDMADANLLNIKAGIAEKRGDLLNKMALQETDDVTKEAKSTWHNAQYAGTPGIKGHDPTDTITIPAFSKSGQPKRVTVSNPTVAAELHKVAYITGEIHRINREAALQIGLLDKVGTTDVMGRREINHKLKSLADEKAALGSVKLQQGVLKEEEYWRALTNTVGFSGEILSGQQVSKAERDRIQRFLRHQDTQAYRQLTGAVQSAGGSEVGHRFVQQPDGSLKKVQLEKGKLFEPDPIPPEGDAIK